VGAVAAGAVSAAVVSAVVSTAAAVVSTAAAVVSTAAAEDQCQPLVSSLLWSGGDDGSIFVDTVNILATFGYYLASFLASVYLLVSQKEMNIWPSIRATNIKNEYTNKEVVILYAYPCIGPKKSPFWQNKYTKDGCEGKKPSLRRKTVFCVFVYLCICVSGQRNHSLRPISDIPLKNLR
jgi:hypothetical protein